MGMRIRTNISALKAQRFAEQNSNTINKSYERLSSGYRINRSSDDAAGLAISENIRGKARGLAVAKRNASDAVSMIQIAEGGMNEMSNIMVRLRELTVQSASDTIGDQERSYLNREYTQMVDEMDRIAKTTEYNDLKFFNTEKTKLVIQVGVNGTDAESNEDTITLDLSGIQFQAANLGLGKESEIGPREDDLSDAPSREEIATRLGTIDNALKRITSERATLGAVQNRIETAISSLGISMENMTNANSRLRDADFAEETSNLTQSRILQQASAAVMGQANTSQEMALQLLR